MNHRPGLNPSGLSGEPLSDHGLREDTAWVPSEGQSFWMVSLWAIYGYIYKVGPPSYKLAYKHH